MNRLLRRLLLWTCLGLLSVPGIARERKAWNSQAAAAYLDARAGWWRTWPRAARDHDTFCISCHTALPYALARPVLRFAAGEKAPSGIEQQVLDNVRRRVRLWSESQPFYTDEKSGANKSLQSRGTEAVLNALILSNEDRVAGTFTPESRKALDQMLPLQVRDGASAGAWPWLNFENQPWEASDSQFWGATLAAIAIGNSPPEYRGTEPVTEAVQRLTTYLSQERGKQSMLNQVGLLWASARLPEVLSKDDKKALIRELLSKQKADGGWRVSELVASGWKRKDLSSWDEGSDGYATALVAYVLQVAGVSRSSPEITSALRWIAAHQDSDTGQLRASSLNRRRDPLSDAGRFMTDAATAYAVLAMDGRF